MSIINSQPLIGASGNQGYNIQRSLRFRSSASAYLNRTPSTTTNRQIWTWSAWFKQGNALNSIFSTNSSDNLSYNYFGFDTNAFRLYQWNGSGYDFQFITTPVYRDPSAWYHFVIQVDTTQATAANRVRFYVNGVQVTAFSTNTTPSQNLNTYVNNSSYSHLLCRNPAGSSTYCDGYLAEINFIDGQALTPSSFGQTNSATGVWQPAKYTGTYGTNGFYLPFTDTTSTTTISEDFSGNNNDWTSNNISLTAGSTYDSMTDVPTNTNSNTANYATFNPVYKATSQPTFSNGNLTIASNAGAYQNSFSTIGISSGKFYWETKITGTTSSANYIGVSSSSEVNYLVTNSSIVGATSTGYSCAISNGDKYSNSSQSAYGSSLSSGDILMCALDLTNGGIYWGKNGTWFNSGNPATQTNPAFTGLSGEFFSGFTTYTHPTLGVMTYDVNFGQQPFSYTPPTGFVALNTFNLPTPTIGATASTQANKYFDATLYTGNSSTNNIVNAGAFKPDLVWTKDRSAANNHMLGDSVRGTNNTLFSNLTVAAYTDRGVDSFNSNGFTYSGTEGGDGNVSGNSYVAWQWQAGQGTTSTNTAGSITSTVSVNTTAGFSIVTYTGNNTSGATVGHGLGVAPAFYIVKQRTASSATSWYCYHSSIDATPQNYAIYLNLTNAKDPSSLFWNNTAPTSSVFSLGTSSGVNGSSGTYVAYCFAQVAGYSAFGSYTGNGSSDGTFIYLGFRPKFFMIKDASSGTLNWYMLDSARNIYNVIGEELYPSLSNAGSTNTDMDFLSNGIKLRNSGGGVNNSGDTFIYAAFAENPFKYSLAR